MASIKESLENFGFNILKDESKFDEKTGTYKIRIVINGDNDNQCQLKFLIEPDTSNKRLVIVKLQAKSSNNDINIQKRMVYDLDNPEDFHRRFDNMVLIPALKSLGVSPIKRLLRALEYYTSKTKTRLVTLDGRNSSLISKERGLFDLDCKYSRGKMLFCEIKYDIEMYKAHQPVLFRLFGFKEDPATGTPIIEKAEQIDIDSTDIRAMYQQIKASIDGVYNMGASGFIPEFKSYEDLMDYLKEINDNTLIYRKQAHYNAISTFASATDINMEDTIFAVRLREGNNISKPLCIVSKSKENSKELVFTIAKSEGSNIIQLQKFETDKGDWKLDARDIAPTVVNALNVA